MLRTARASQANVCYHVLNRGNRRAEVFHQEGDYAGFVRVLRQACARVPMRILGYCLMPNHFHLVLWPSGAGDLSDWMQWLLTEREGNGDIVNCSEGNGDIVNCSDVKPVSLE